MAGDKPLPKPSPLTRVFWEGTKEGKPIEIFHPHCAWPTQNPLREEAECVGVVEQVVVAVDDDGAIRWWGLEVADPLDAAVLPPEVPLDQPETGSSKRTEGNVSSWASGLSRAERISKILF